jgi:hypothetical protein
MAHFLCIYFNGIGTVMKLKLEDNENLLNEIMEIVNRYK